MARAGYPSIVGAALLAAGLAWPGWALLVADEAGIVRWRVPVSEGTPVVLQYTNSLYLAPTWEQFVIRNGRLEMVSMSSTREAVLEYNRLAPPYRREGPRVTAPVSGISLTVLPLRVGERGRPVLTVDGATVPLYQAGVGAGLRISVRRESRLLARLGIRTP